MYSTAIVLITFPVFAANALFNTLRQKFNNQIVDSLQGAEVTLFSPALIPGASTYTAAPAFTRDGNTVYFGQVTNGKPVTLMMSSFKNGKWSEAVVAPFCGNYRNLEPSIAPDGKSLIFASNRTTNTDTVTINGYWSKTHHPARGGNLWKLFATKQGWSKPERLPDIINLNTSVFSPAIAKDGSLYFMRADSGKGFRIYFSKLRQGKYSTPDRASFSTSIYSDFDPVVASDNSFLIFSSGRPPAKNSTDLFIVFRTLAGDWSEPVDLKTLLGDKVFGIEARLSPDNKILYFTNSLNTEGKEVPTEQYIWQVNINRLIKAHDANKH